MKSGYTLVELLVVMTILSLIGLFTFINLGNFRQDKLLDATLTNLQSLIRTAQANAHSGVVCAGVGGATWSVEFKDDKTANLKCKADSQQNDTTVSSASPEAGVKFQSISSGSGCNSAFPQNSVTVNFLPLSSGISFVDLTSNCISSGQYISVTLSGKTGVKTVKINKGGSIN